MWIQRWYGSGGKEGYEGWSIIDAETRELISYLGRDVSSEVVSELVRINNEIEKAFQTKEWKQPIYEHRLNVPLHVVSVTCKVQE